MSDEKQKNISGTPWHVGFVTKKPLDPRRDKRVCVYYHNNYCRMRNGECIGSSHCAAYKRVGETAIRNERKIHHQDSSYKMDSRFIYQKDIIQRGDTVVVFCKQTNQEYPFVISRDIHAELPPIQEKSLGKRKNDRIVCNGYQYEIRRILKG